MSFPAWRKISFSSWCSCQFEQLRLFFESSLVRYAAEHATDEQIDLLAKALEINSQSLDNNAAFIRSDVDFHRVLAEIQVTQSSWRSTLPCSTG